MLKKIMLPALLVMGMSASADEGSVKGLIGVEVGSMGNEIVAEDGGKDNVNTASAGLKLGAESRHYRVFIDARYWYADEFYSAGSIGGAVQYLIRPAEMFNIFLGVNAGFVNTIGDTDTVPYYGMDAGFNLDMSEDFGIEAGVRAAACDGKDYKEATTLYQAYVSAIFKFDTDY